MSLRKDSVRATLAYIDRVEREIEEAPAKMRRTARLIEEAGKAMLPMLKRATAAMREFGRVYAEACRQGGWPGCR